jgi:uncharacterized membrane protein
VNADARSQPVPAQSLTGTTVASEERHPHGPGVGLPRWAAAVLTASGLIIVVAETTSLLFFAGLLLAGFGIYGFVAGVRARRAALEAAAYRTGVHAKERSKYGS